jgi:hypothetical protein
MWGSINGRITVSAAPGIKLDLISKITSAGAGSVMAQVIELREVLSSNPRTTKKKKKTFSNYDHFFCFLFVCLCIYYFLSILFLFVCLVWEFELRASRLLGKLSTT